MRVPAACHYPFATLAHKLSKQNNSVYISHIPHPPANKHTHTHTHAHAHPLACLACATLFAFALHTFRGASAGKRTHVRQTNERTNKQTTATTIKTLMKCVQIFRKIYKHTPNDARQNRVLSRAAQCSTAQQSTQDMGRRTYSLYSQDA